jgi:hypothetical protein
VASQVSGHVAPPNSLEKMPLVNHRMVHVYCPFRNYQSTTATSTHLSTTFQLTIPATCMSMPCVNLSVVTRITYWLVHLLLPCQQSTVPLPHQLYGMMPCHLYSLLPHQHDDVNRMSVLTFLLLTYLTFCLFGKMIKV